MTEGKIQQLSSGQTLRMVLDPDQIPRFFLFFQRGVRIRVQTGINIREFLCSDLGLSPEYVEKRVQTVFLDGKAVDDVDAAVVRDGSTLALSAALPGVLGATLRRGSYYAAMRSQISYSQEQRSVSSGEGTVCLKLFNLLTEEVGPLLLSKGVWITGHELQDFFSRQSDRFWTGCRQAFLNGRETDARTLGQGDWAEGLIFLQINEG